MKNILLFCILFLVSAACLAAPTPTAIPEETEVAVQLTAAAALIPTERPIPPGIPTIPPPAVSAPTRMATATEVPSPTALSITLAPVPTAIPRKSTEIVPTSDVRSITYSITGEAEQVDLTYVNPDQSVENALITLPFEKTMVFKLGAPLSLFAKTVGKYGTITCKISSGDQILLENSVSGIDKTAFCSDIKAE